MKDRVYKLILFNAGGIIAIGAILLSGARNGGWGAFLAGLAFVVLGACGVILAPNFQDPPPTYEDLRKMMRSFYSRVFTP